MASIVAQSKYLYHITLLMTKLIFFYVFGNILYLRLFNFYIMEANYLFYTYLFVTFIYLNKLLETWQKYIIYCFIRKLLLGEYGVIIFTLKNYKTIYACIFSVFDIHNNIFYLESSDDWILI